MATPSDNVTSGNTTILNVPILYAAVGVAVAIITERLADSKASSAFDLFLSGVSLGMVLITTTYALFVLIWQGWRIWQEPAQAAGICRSATFAAFLLSLVMVESSGQLTPAAGLSLCLGVLALMGFVAVSIPGSGNGKPGGTVSTEGHVEQCQAVAVGEQQTARNHSYMPAVRYPETRTPAPLLLHSSSIDTSNLPPLFDKDPLYRLPRPRLARFFSVVKGNDLPVASDDACTMSEDETRFALCDGASVSSLPRPWAALLGQQWVKHPFEDIDAETLVLWLQEPRERWRRWVQETWRREIDARNAFIGNSPITPEVFRRTLQTGAAATFLGLVLHQENASWHAFALGDTCLFLARRDKSTAWRLRLSFPLDNSARFGDRPLLLASNDGNEASLIPHFRSMTGAYRRGDVLMMATDALAQWMLSQVEQQQADWCIFPILTDPQRFAKLIEQERQDGRMADDDTTLVVIPL
jgi:hypothetical protein